MPVPNQDAFNRIDRATRYVETQLYDQTGLPFAPSADTQLEWYALSGNFDGTTHEADAHPVNWDASGGSGAGKYKVDTSTTRKVRMSTMLADSDDSAHRWVLCRPIGSDKGAVWEIIGWDRVLGKIADGSSLSYHGSCTVKVYFGTPGSEADAGITLTAWDWCLKSGQTVAAGTQVICQLINGAWYVTSAQCG